MGGRGGVSEGGREAGERRKQRVSEGGRERGREGDKEG